jgi:hypothetical protein
MKASWYIRRLFQMSPLEIGYRLGDEIRKLAWRPRQLGLGEHKKRLPIVGRPAFEGPDLAGASSVPAEALARLLGAAEGILAGSWPVFARNWDTVEMDWFRDPRTGKRAPQTSYCFSIDHRDEGAVGNVKYVWEPSRHHLLTVLASAYRLSRDDRYAAKAVNLLRSWMDQNPFLSGIHWTSGIEVGVRLISWVWCRRLLDSYPGVTDAFERNQIFLEQLRHHQQFVAAFHSRGSSANNHLVAEMTGLFLSACAFPWFPESNEWKLRSHAVLTEEVKKQTFATGLNRELATSYHGFVTEMFLLAMLEGESSGHAFGADSWEIVRKSIDAIAAMVDQDRYPPRQGDDDEAFSLLLDAPSFQRWESLLETGRLLFGPLDWWPRFPPSDVRSALLTALARPPASLSPSRPRERPSTYSDAGVTILRTYLGEDELWCRVDHGPHGYLSIAAHAHADALSVEVRFAGVPVLVDPGTFSYHGDPAWRYFFRSTLAHNTVEIARTDQSVSAGPFMWTSHAVTSTEYATSAQVLASHDGYRRLRPPVTHRRSVSLEPLGTVTIEDWIEGVHFDHEFRIAFHLGPTLDCCLTDNIANLSWSGGAARLQLPSALRWQVVRGQREPLLGWYSAGFDVVEPTYSLVGTGEGPQPCSLVTELSVGRERPDRQLLSSNTRGSK